MFAIPAIDPIDICSVSLASLLPATNDELHFPSADVLTSNRIGGGYKNSLSRCN